MTILSKLEQLRSIGGEPMTQGLADEIIARFAESDPRLEQAVDDALGVIKCWSAAYPDLIAANEIEQKEALQAAYVNLIFR